MDGWNILLWNNEGICDRNMGTESACPSAIPLRTLAPMKNEKVWNIPVKNWERKVIKFKFCRTGAVYNTTQRYMNCICKPSKIFCRAYIPKVYKNKYYTESWSNCVHHHIDIMLHTDESRLP